MANPQHVELMRQGQDAIWEWQQAHPGEFLDLSNTDCRELRLAGIWVWWIDFSGSDLSGQDLSHARLVGSRFNGAVLRNADFRGALLVLADFESTNLRGVRFDHANLAGANLRGASVDGATFDGAILNRAVLPESIETSYASATIHYRGLSSSGRGSTDRLRAFVPFSVVQTISDVRRPLRGFVPQARAQFAFQASLAGRAIAFLSWPLVHRYGNLHLLTKASYLALILVPILAFLWPSVVRLVDAHDAAIMRSMREAERVSAAITTTSTKLRATGTTSASRALDNMAREAERLSRRLASHLIGQPRFPMTFAAIYAAAISVGVGHLLYQIFADEIVKRTSRQQFVRDALSTFTPTAPDAHLRLEAALRIIHTAASARPDEYHRQLVYSSGVLTYVPPVAADFAGLAPYYAWAAVEAAAAIEYDLAAKRALVPAAVSLACYVIATAAIVYVVAQQALSVWSATQM